MIILGMDLATQTGVCFGRPDTTPTCRVYKAPSTGEDLAAFGAYYWRTFNALLDQLESRLEPGESILVNYESPWLMKASWDPEKKKMVERTNINTTRKLQGLGVLLETVCELHPAPIKVHECNILSVKKELAGKGRAEKADMVIAARRAGIQLPEGSEAYDAADAFGCWLLAIRHKAPQHSPAWDRRINGQARGDG